MKIKEVLDRTTQFFKDKKIETARLDAEILLSTCLGLNRLDLYLKFDQPLKETELEKCREVVRRRALGEPVAYILGTKGFLSYDFIVNSDVLIPRPETELLVEEAFTWYKEKQLSEVNILDLGCGSGCIGLSLLKLIPSSKATLVDISEKALAVAKRNAEALGVIERTDFICCDAKKLSTDQKFQIILANPPYIGANDRQVQKSVKDFEPHHALFSEEDGLNDLKVWSENIISNLDTSGLMGFEHGLGQSQQMKNHFEKLGCFGQIKVIQDYSKIDRHIVGTK